VKGLFATVSADGHDPRHRGGADAPRGAVLDCPLPPLIDASIPRRSRYRFLAAEDLARRHSRWLVALVCGCALAVAASYTAVAALGYVLFSLFATGQPSWAWQFHRGARRHGDRCIPACRFLRLWRGATRDPRRVSPRRAYVDPGNATLKRRRR